MDEKKEQLKESIAKLLSLKVSDAEILLNLKDVGLHEREARALLEETKKDAREPLKPPEIKVIKNQGFTLHQRELKIKPKIKKEIELKKEPLKVVGASKKEERIDIFAPQKKGVPASGASIKSDSNVLELWEKGIMATVNSKLAQMEKIKSDLDRVLDGKIQKELAKEIKKIEIVFESQRNLGASYIKGALEKKSKEVEEIINMKISDLSNASSLNEKILKELESKKNENQIALEKTNEMLGEVSKLKSTLLSDMNSELIKSKSDIESFLSESDKIRKETVSRINRSLELESKIVEGLMTDAKQKIDALGLEKTNAIEKDLQSKYESKSRELDQKLRKIEELEKKIDLDTIKTTMEELDAFKKQFSLQIKKNVESFNSSKREITKHIEERESLLDKQLEVLRLKVKEFEAFEEEFAEQIGMQIDRLSEKKKALKPKKNTLGDIIKNKTHA